MKERFVLRVICILSLVCFIGVNVIFGIAGNDSPLREFSAYLSIAIRLLGVLSAFCCWRYAGSLSRSKLGWALGGLILPFIVPYILSTRDDLTPKPEPARQREYSAPLPETNQVKSEAQPARSVAESNPEWFRNTQGAKKSCKHCGTITLTRSEFIKELAEKHGISVDPNNIDRFRVSGVGMGINAYDIAVSTVREKYERVQKKRAFRCRDCGAIYCMECLLKYSPAHINGGKGCISCGGAFTEA